MTGDEIWTFIKAGGLAAGMGVAHWAIFKGWYVTKSHHTEVGSMYVLLVAAKQAELDALRISFKELRDDFDDSIARERDNGAAWRGATLQLAGGVKEQARATLDLTQKQIGPS